MIQEMIDKIGAPAAADFAAADRRSQAKEIKAAPKEQPKETPKAQAQPPAENLRLVIERHAGSFVYKLIDRETGQVINAIPRSEIGKLIDSPDYGPGNLVRTTA